MHEHLRVIENQLPKGIMRSAVSLPCFFEVLKSQKVAGHQSQQGTKSCRMWRNSVHLSVCRPSKGSGCQLEGSEGQLVGSEVLLEESEGLPEGFEGLP